MNGQSGSADAVVLGVIGLVLGYGLVAGPFFIEKAVGQHAAALDDEASNAHCPALLGGEQGCILPPSDHEHSADGALCAVKTHLPEAAAWPGGLPECD